MSRDYVRMARAGHALTDNARNLPVVRLAILSDNSTQQLAKVLKAELYETGFYPEIHEGEIDGIATEVFDETSALHEFQPEYVWLNLSSQSYRERFYQASLSDKESVPAIYAEEIGRLIDALAARGYRIILNSLAAPLERMFGNYSARTLHSPMASVAEANRLLLEKIKATPRCSLNDVAFLAAKAGLEHWADERLWAHSKYLCAADNFPRITESIAAILRAARGRIVKCVVLDLDNTLWGGVIGDDGIDGIELGGMGPGEAYERFQRYLLQLKNRGILLAVCSKNDEENARLPFQKHTSMVLKESDIAVFVANWNAKSANIEHIGKVLNLGIDSFLFVDDNPFERNEVRMALPTLLVPEMPEDVVDYPACLEASGYFETTAFSEEDRKRAGMYQEEARRTTLQAAAKDIHEYLASLEMKITCRPFDAQHMARIAQLLQRSNQFNLRTQRFSEGQCQDFMADPARYPCFYIKLRDKVGDYGLISIVCTERVEDRLDILEYVMSCRVLSRGVEQYTMTHLVNYCRAHGLATLRGEYIATEKNRMVSKFYEKFGFKQVEGTEARTVWELAVADFVAPEVFIQPDFAEE
jgi:FkbH-like protein